MSSSVCELSVESRFVRSPFHREPCPPFYRRRGEQGLQVKNTKGIEGPSKGSGLPFPQTSLRHDQLVSEVGTFAGYLCADDAAFCKWSRPIPPLQAACRAGVPAYDTMGGERCGTRTLVSIGDVSPIAVFVSGSVLEG